MYDRIVVATDGSDPAARALEAAVSLAATFDADLHAVTVGEPTERPPDEAESGADAPVRDGGVLEAAEARASEAGVRVTATRLSTDDAVHEALVRYATDHGADLLVLGTHGRSGFDRLVLGSVSEHALRAAPMPVLTVHADTPVRALEDVLVATDGSEPATAAVEHAVALAAAADATLHVVNVVDVTVTLPEGAGAPVFEALEDAGEAATGRVQERASDADVETVHEQLLSGSTDGAIVDYADEQDVDCIVLGTHGRTGVDRVLVGSVAERVARTARQPVICVKAPGAEK